MGRSGIGGDKYRNTTSQHATNVEPDSFAWGNTIVSAYQVGRFNNGGGSNVGFATSTDGGQTWRKGGLPGTTVHATPGPWARVSDPVVAYDPEHDVWMIGTLGINASAIGAAVLTSRSTDGGLTWQPPVTRVGGAGNLLRQELARLRHVGAEPALRQLLRGVGRQRPRQPDADEHLDGRRADVGAEDSPSECSVRARRSAGGPAERHSRRAVHRELRRDLRVPLAGRWRDLDVTSTVASQSTANVAGSLRDPPLPSAEVDSVGKVWVAWHDCPFRPGCAMNDIVYSTSTDGVDVDAEDACPDRPDDEHGRPLPARDRHRPGRAAGTDRHRLLLLPAATPAAWRRAS